MFNITSLISQIITVNSSIPRSDSTTLAPEIQFEFPYGLDVPYKIILKLHSFEILKVPTENIAARYADNNKAQIERVC